MVVSRATHFHVTEYTEQHTDLFQKDLHQHIEKHNTIFFETDVLHIMIELINLHIEKMVLFFYEMWR